mgnify:CR=1 FL=1
MGDSRQSTVIITGASSGVGLHATRSLVDRGWQVIMACRNLEKAKAAAASLEIPASAVRLIEIDLGSLASVRRFVRDFNAAGLPLDDLFVLNPSMTFLHGLYQKREALIVHAVATLPPRGR